MGGKMDTMTITRKTKGWLTTFAAIAIMATLMATTYAEQTIVKLAAGGGAPEASGIATIELVKGVLAGIIEVNNLPPQPFASGHFYGGWFVRTDTDNKAFLGALINNQSIIFSTGGSGEMQINATQFTDGPDAGSPITFGPAGTNTIIVLIENNIDGFTPSPIGPVPGPGVAVSGTF